MTRHKIAHIVILHPRDTFYRFQSSNTPLKTTASIYKSQNPVILRVAINYSASDHRANSTPCRFILCGQWRTDKDDVFNDIERSLRCKYLKSLMDKSRT